MPLTAGLQSDTQHHPAACARLSPLEGSTVRHNSENGGTFRCYTAKVFHFNCSFHRRGGMKGGEGMGGGGSGVAVGGSARKTSHILFLDQFVSILASDGGCKVVQTF